MQEERFDQWNKVKKEVSTREKDKKITIGKKY